MIAVFHTNFKNIQDKSYLQTLTRKERNHHQVTPFTPRKLRNQITMQFSSPTHWASPNWNTIVFQTDRCSMSNIQDNCSLQTQEKGRKKKSHLTPFPNSTGISRKLPNSQTLNATRRLHNTNTPKSNHRRFPKQTNALNIQHPSR